MRLYEVIRPVAYIPGGRNDVSSDDLVINTQTMYEPEEQIAFIKEHLDLETECSQILSVYRQTNQFLYRGMRNRPAVFRSGIRDDRKPLEMPEWIHNLLLKAYRRLGVAAHRGNSIFATPDEKIADVWGDAYIIFPTNGFKFSWFTTITDGQYPWDQLQRIAYGAVSKGDQMRDAEQGKEIVISTIVDELTELGLRQDDLTAAMHAWAEVLITGSEFYAFHASNWRTALRTIIKN